jgi:tRNA1Val (adenine37-N6)-methyltransferase
MTITSTIDHLKKNGKATKSFYFKQFMVEDGSSTMKVGTDAVLLGAVTEVNGATYILEIGTGCGVIALILAQRSKAQIDAIEIDEESVNQASENAVNSPWQDRITNIHSSLQDFIQHADKKYDLIVSNPPFFSRSLKSSDEKRNISRHDDLLSFNELINGSLHLMSHEASLWVILPAKESRDFNEKCQNSGFFLHSEFKIVPKTGKGCHRIITHYKKTSTGVILKKTLTIKNSNNSYTDEYKEVTKEFYLDF